jgi:site-specific recombinase XerD
LNDSALAVLRQLDTKGQYDFLFINKQTALPYTGIHKVWGRMRKQAGLPELRIHDLRHQFASFLVNAGQSLYTVQQLLGHSTPVVTQRYAHLSTKALQDASNVASQHIQAAMGG